MKANHVMLFMALKIQCCLVSFNVVFFVTGYSGALCGLQMLYLPRKK